MAKKQSRRVNPRAPYDEAVCLARVDGRGRLYTRSLDLSRSGIYVVCDESVPVGTEVQCTLLLGGGPRTVTGKVVRVTALARGLGLAVAFSALKPGTAAAIDRFVAASLRDVRPAKLRIDGVERPLRCEGRIEDGVVRLTAALPFLRLDGGVTVVLGEEGEAGALTSAGVIRKIALDPSPSDGVPRLAFEVVLADSQAVPAATASEDPTPPPIRLPPPCGHPLPSVVVSRTFQHDLRRAEERPPRRRVGGTAEIFRRPLIAEWAAPLSAATAPIRKTVRVELRKVWGASRRVALALLVPAALAVAAILIRL